MKLQKLTLHNLASIEDAVIDFEAEPLANSEVFLISGKTGAGKSTLLDGICLALFADTPRLAGTQMEGKTTEGNKDFTLRDPRQLLRRNTAEGWVQLTFVGSNEVAYEARWGVARARKKVTGNLQSKEWTLTNLTTGHTWSKDTEIREEITRAIGLDFNQFCRTTMLAQGEFTRFLNSKDEEKALILEKITGVDAYSRIGKKTYALYTEKRNEAERASKAVADIRLMREEELETLKNGIEQKQQQQAQCQQDYELLRRALNDKEEIRQGEANLEQLKHQQEQAEARYLCILAGEAALQQHITDVKNEGNLLQERQNAEECRKEELEQSQKILLTASKLQDRMGRSTREKQVIKDESHRLQTTLQQEKNAVSEEIRQQQASYEQLQSRLYSQEAQLKQLGLNDLRHQKEEQQKTLTCIETTEAHCSTLQAEKQSEKRLNDQLTELGQQHQALQDQLQDLQAPLEEAEKKSKFAKQMWERQKESIDRWAKSMRARLQVGDCCPVCRKPIEAELPHEEEIKQLVDELERSNREAEEKYMELEKQKNTLTSQLIAQQKIQEARLKDLEQLQKKLADLERKVTEGCQLCGVPYSLPETLGTLAQLKEQVKVQMQQLSNRIAEGEALEKEVESTRKQADKQRKLLENAQEKARKVELKRTECQSKIETAQHHVTELEGERAQLETELAYLVEPTHWQYNWHEALAEFMEELAAKQASYKTLLQELQRQQQQQERHDNEHKQLTDILSRIAQLRPEWRELPLPDAREMKDVNAQANQLLLDLTQWSTQRSTIETELQKHHQQLDAFLSAHEELTEDGLANQAKELENLREQLSQQVGADRLKLEQDETNRKSQGLLMAEAEVKRKEYQKWERLNQLIGDAEGKNFRKIAQSYVLASLIHAANGYMKTLSDRYRLEVVPGSFVILLEDAYQGYTKRAASTISGGECFLVSLALALALSDIGQRLSVDTLFIDEGFGTLSGEPLQRAVDTLKNLHRQEGRHVGIISHVEELRERIPVQIQVTQEGTYGCSKVEVV